MIKHLINRMKQETVLSAAWLLALLSAFWVHPSADYLSYIDIRTLGILWSMMVIMAGLKAHGFFARVGGWLLERAGSRRTLILILVFLCFFFSMLITNDVALLTFVPFAISLLSEGENRRLIVPVVILQTLAANLGSMLTPIGNPQNLYLYGLSGMGMREFLGILLPYTLLTALLLLLACLFLGRQGGKSDRQQISCGREEDGKTASAGRDRTGRPVMVYGGLFLLTLLTVLRILPWYIPAALILAAVLFMEKEILLRADYVLLATFIGFFIFTGNMGNISAIADTLQQLVEGHETQLGIAVSQIISNVPAALLLSGFTRDYRALIVGVNLGGLGTLIASMASLISYKFVAAELPEAKGSYFRKFTLANLIYLVILIGMWVLMTEM